MTTKWNGANRRMSGFAPDTKCAPSLAISHADPEQSYPQHYPQDSRVNDNRLGAPLSIQEVARLIGCSDWTVRQRWLPQGLPHLRTGPTGKFIFYREQVVAWILEQQQKGGTY